MTKAELLVRHFARCFREYRNRTPEVQKTVERLVVTATDSDVTEAERADAISTLMSTLFPNGVEENEFAGRVARLLRRKGMDQRDLADALGVRGPVVSRMLSGRHRPRQQTVERVAVALGVRPDELRPI